jgi:hypothetical protein
LKDRQHNGQKEKDQKNKQRFHLQKITQKTKDQVTRTPLKTDPAVMLFSACMFRQEKVFINEAVLLKTSFAEHYLKFNL